ncbi:MAG: hypothetical protein ABSG34_18590 [Candidatus Sulfotelmatobacter sp.]
MELETKPSSLARGGFWLLGLIGILSISSFFTSKYHSSPRTSEHTDGSNANQGSSIQPTVANTESNATPSGAFEVEPAAHREVQIWEKISSSAQALVALVTLGLLAINIFMLSANKRAANAAKESADLTRHVFEDNDSADLQIFLRQGQNEYAEIHVRNTGKFPSPKLDASFTLERIEVRDDSVLETIKTDGFSKLNLRPYDINLENDFVYITPSNTRALKKQIDTGEMALRVKGALSYDNGFKRSVGTQFCWETYPNNTPIESWDTCDRAKMHIDDFKKENARH